VSYIADQARQTGEGESPQDWQAGVALSMLAKVEVEDRLKILQVPAAKAPAWEPVTLGIAIPRSYFCICCLTFNGSGMHRNGITYCVPCWDSRQAGNPCLHGSRLELIGKKAS
jgi:hypothetical protein